MEHKEIILSTIAGLATIFVGYVVWRHEQTISAENAQAQQDAQAAQDAQAQQNFMNEIASLPTAGSYGGGASSQSYYQTNVPDTGSVSLQSPASQSNDLQAILSAFYPSTTTPAAATNTSTPQNNLPPTTPTDLASFITSQLNTGTANQTYNLNLPTTLTNYVAPVASSIYH